MLIAMESIRERIIALVEVGYSARQAAEVYGINPRTAQKWIKRYRETGEVARRNSTGRKRVTSQDQDRRLVAEARANPHSTASQLRHATNYPGSRQTAIRRLQEANLHARRSAVKEFLSNDHKRLRLQFAGENVHRDWTDVIFTDECTFSSANNGPAVVYRPRGARFHPQYVHHKRSCGRVSVSVWGWISSSAFGILHRIDGRLTGEQYLHILREVMLPSARLLYPDGVLQMQHDNSPIHKCRLVQEWLRSQDDVAIIPWPPRGADMSPIENVWANVKRTMRANWPEPPTTTADALWQLVLAAWEEEAESSEGFLRSLYGSMPRRMQAVIQANGCWTSY